jgi:mannose/cellobiose epimerase-like protein (N-acyl-D-glucosamine 2-epimerase family)
MFKITNALYDIEQRAAQAWLDAMLAKGIFEETFAQAYDSPSTGTIEARQSKAKMSAAQDRYWAIYLSAYSRRADAICRSLSLLGQRLKDSLNT